jgi:uncharacterized protein YdeI (BOF family)
MPDTIRRIFGLMLFLALPLAASAAVPIDTIRDLPLGTVVTVEGRVTVLPGLFESASLEDQGFVLQDATGGIYVNIDTRLDIRLHQKIRVTGMLEEVFNIRFVATDVADVDLLPKGPLLVPTGEVGEATEGRVITVSGVVTEEVFDERPYGFQFPIDDGSGEVAIFVHASTGINPLKIPYLVVGETIRVTGYSGRFSDEFEIQPRFRRDIRLGTPP